MGSRGVADACGGVIEELTRVGVDTAVLFIGLTVHRKDGKSVPTLTVMGDKDEITPEQCRRLTHVLIDAATAALNEESRRG